jgi:hypothetical protein
MKKYDWAIIGGGITGIVLGEILIREGHSVVLIEKNQTLASETTRDFHEWLHTGSLYTLIPDKLKTLKFILGAVDDLLEYYSCYERMNLIPTMAGMKIDNLQEGWFESNYIDFKFRIKNRKIVLPWLMGVARSMFLIEKIHQHDWLRRRAGELEPFKQGRNRRILSIIAELVQSKQKFRTVTTPDFTINSRALMRDILTTAIEKGLELSFDNEVNHIESSGNIKIIKGTKADICAEKVAVCAGSGVKDFSRVRITTSYAPIAVVSGVPESAKSFVELDYYPANCINLLTKKNGMGLVGGISFKNKSKCEKYLNTVVKKQQLLFPEIKEVDRYIGVKNEITFEEQPRSYLYHIVEIEKDIWSVIPGKFTLAFSLAPEFYRRVYLKNPRKVFKTYMDNNKYSNQVANTVWFDSMEPQ